MKHKLICLAAMLFLLAACDKKKEEPPEPKPPVHKPVNMTLYDKSLEVMKDAVGGRWKIYYYHYFGGLSGDNYDYLTNSYATFVDYDFIIDHKSDDIRNIFKFAQEKETVGMYNANYDRFMPYETYVIENDPNALKYYLYKIRNDTLFIGLSFHNYDSYVLINHEQY